MRNWNAAVKHARNSNSTYYYSFDIRHTSTLYMQIQLKYTVVSKVTSHVKDEGKKEAKE